MKAAPKTKTHIRKAQIKTAALEIVRSQGPGAVTVSLIAERVGVTKSDLYRHFGGKEEVYAAIIAEISDALQGVVERAKRSGRPAAALKAVYFEHLAYYEKNRNYPRLLFSELLYSADEALLAKFAAYLRAYLDAIEDILKRGLVKTEAEAATAALVFLGQIQALTLQWMLSGCRFSLKARAEKFWPFYLQSLGAPS